MTTDCYSQNWSSPTPYTQYPPFFGHDVGPLLTKEVYTYHENPGFPKTTLKKRVFGVGGRLGPSSTPTNTCSDSAPLSAGHRSWKVDPGQLSLFGLQLGCSFGAPPHGKKRPGCARRARFAMRSKRCSRLAWQSRVSETSARTRFCISQSLHRWIFVDLSLRQKKRDILQVQA